MEPQEIWKDIKGYEGYYQVSDFGNVKSLEKLVKSRERSTGINTRKIVEKLKELHITNAGYLRVSLCKFGSNKKFSVHRLVALSFIPNPENKPCVNHKDGNKRNNSLKNLEWVTYSENETHSYSVLGKKIICSQETKNKMSKAKNGIKLSESHKQSLRKPKIKNGK